MSAPVDAVDRVLIDQDVVERAGQTGERIGRLAQVEVLLGVGVPGRVQQPQRILHPVGVEVADQRDRRRRSLDRWESSRAARWPAATRDAFDAPCPSPVSASPGDGPAEPLDLKWFITNRNGAPPSGVKTWEIGSLALSKGSRRRRTLGAQRMGVTGPVDLGRPVDDRVGDDVHLARPAADRPRMARRPRYRLRRPRSRHRPGWTAPRPGPR